MADVTRTIEKAQQPVARISWGTTIAFSEVRDILKKRERSHEDYQSNTH
jgi:hypothetical protein